MRVKVLRPFWYEGAIKSIGTEVDLPDALGREVVFGGKAALVKVYAASVPEPIKQPMTTKTAGVLAGKKD